MVYGSLGAQTLPVISQTEPSMLMASVLGQDAKSIDEALIQLTTSFGPLLYISELFSFPFTAYYQCELGDNPQRRFVAFERFEDPSTLHDIKRTTCRFEVMLSRPGRPRSVNLDPGFINEHQVILASTKKRAHRIYVGRGIYADLMLLYQHDQFVTLPWTYPDYAEMEIRILLSRLRNLYLTIRRLGALA